MIISNEINVYNYTDKKNEVIVSKWCKMYVENE